MRIYSNIIFLACLMTPVVLSSVYAKKATHLERIQQYGILRVAVFHDDFAPFFWKDEKTGELRGVDIDLARGIAKELDVKVEFNRTATSFDRMVEMVANEEVDIVISILSATPQRARLVLFTDSYVAMRRGLIVNKVRLASLNLPAGVSIVQYMKEAKVQMAGRRGSSYVLWTRQLFPNADILIDAEGSDGQVVVDMVDTGKTVACLVDEMFIKKSILQRPRLALNLQTILFSDKIDSIAMAVPPTSAHFHNWLNSYLEAKNIDYNVDDLIRMYPDGM